MPRPKRILGVIQEHKRIRQIGCGFPDDLKLRLIKASEVYGLSFSAMVRVCCKEYLDFKDKQGMERQQGLNFLKGSNG